MADKEAEARAILRKQERFARQERLNEDFALRALVGSIEGRQFLWWLLRIGKVGLQPFASDAHVTAFSCGELNVGQQVLARILETEPAGYLRMIQEQADNDRARREQDVSISGTDSSDTGDSDSAS